MARGGGKPPRLPRLFGLGRRPPEPARPNVPMEQLEASFDRIRAYRGGRTPVRELDPARGVETQAVWFSSTRDAAGSYVYPDRPSASIQSADLRLRRPLEIDARGANYDDIPKDLLPQGVRDRIGGRQINARTPEIADAARLEGYDGVVFKNVVDDSSGYTDASGPTTVYAVFNRDSIAEANRLNLRPLAMGAAGAGAALALSDEAEGAGRPPLLSGARSVTRDYALRLGRLEAGRLTADESYFAQRLRDGKAPREIADEMTISDEHMHALIGNLRYARRHGALDFDPPSTGRRGPRSNITERAIELREQGLTTPQIAERLGSTPGSIRVLLHRARNAAPAVAATGGLAAVSLQDEAEAAPSPFRYRFDPEDLPEPKTGRVDELIELAAGPLAEMAPRSARGVMSAASLPLPAPLGMMAAREAELGAEDPRDFALEYTIGPPARLGADVVRRVSGDDDFRLPIIEDPDYTYQGLIDERGGRTAQDTAADAFVTGMIGYPSARSAARAARAPYRAAELSAARSRANRMADVFPYRESVDVNTAAPPGSRSTWAERREAELMGRARLENVTRPMRGSPDPTAREINRTVDEVLGEVEPSYSSHLKTGRNEPLGSRLAQAARLTADENAMLRESTLANRAGRLGRNVGLGAAASGSLMGSPFAIDAASQAIGDMLGGEEGAIPPPSRPPPGEALGIPPGARTQRTYQDLPEFAGAVPRDPGMPVTLPRVPAPPGDYGGLVVRDQPSQRGSGERGDAGADIAPDPELYEAFEIDPTNPLHIKREQEALAELGFYEGQIDGIRGDQTKKAERDIAATFGVEGDVDPSTAYRMTVAYFRGPATVADLQGGFLQAGELHGGRDDIYGPATARRTADYLGVPLDQVPPAWKYPDQEWLNEVVYGRQRGNPAYRR